MPCISLGSVVLCHVRLLRVIGFIQFIIQLVIKYHPWYSWQLILKSLHRRTEEQHGPQRLGRNWSWMIMCIIPFNSAEIEPEQRSGTSLNAVPALDTTVFRLDAWALSVIATATWLAGWVSVTLRYCIKTAKPIQTLFRPSESPIILVFWDPCADTKFQGEPHQRGR